MLGIVLEYLKLSNLCLIIGKTFGLLRLYVIVKWVISSFFTAFGSLKISRGISLAVNMLASISDLEYLYPNNVFFHLFKAFFFYMFIFNSGTYSSCKRERYFCWTMPWVVQSKRDMYFWVYWFVGKHPSRFLSLVWLFSIVNWILLLIWFNIESKWSGFIKLTFSIIWQSSK